MQLEAKEDPDAGDKWQEVAHVMDTRSLPREGNLSGEI